MCRADSTARSTGSRDDGSHEQVASDLGVACGLAFDDEGAMYVGDRSGTIFRVLDARATPFATLPPSVAAFHLAMSPSGELFVSGPTLASYDHVYRIDRQGQVRTISTPLGRPQGLAFAPDGTLHVVDALAGASGVYRFASDDGSPEVVISGGALVGIAFGPKGEIVVASNETAYSFDLTMSQLFARKPIAELQPPSEGDARAQARAGRGRPGHAGDRRGDWRGYLRRDRHRRRRTDRDRTARSFATAPGRR